MNNFKLLVSKLRLSWRNLGLLLLTLIIVRILFLVIIYIWNQNLQNYPTSKISTVNNLPQAITAFPNAQKTPPQWTVFAQKKVKRTPELAISNQFVSSLPPVPKGEQVIVSYSVTVPQVTPQPEVSPTLSPKIVVNSNSQPKTTPQKNPVAVKPQTEPKSTPTTAKKQSNVGVNPVTSNQNQNAIAKPSPKPTPTPKSNPKPSVQLIIQEFPGYPQFPKYQPSQTTSIPVNTGDIENIRDKVSILQTADSLDAVVNFYNQALAEKGYTFTLIVDEVETKIYRVGKGEEKLFLHLFTQPQKPEVIMVVSPEQLTRQVFKL